MLLCLLIIDIADVQLLPVLPQLPLRDFDREAQALALGDVAAGEDKDGGVIVDRLEVGVAGVTGGRREVEVEVRGVDGGDVEGDWVGDAKGVAGAGVLVDCAADLDKVVSLAASSQIQQ